MGKEAKHLYDFGPFRLDAGERVLLRDGRPVSLPPKDLETLLVLVEKRGHLVEKEELLEKVWPGVFVEEGNLARHISNLRQFLTDRSDGKQYIETVPKRGYRFIAQVRETAPQVAARNGPGESPPSVGVPARPWRRRFVWITPLAIVALSVPAYFLWQHFHPRPALTSRRVMLAVLPVQNLTGDPEREYISDGLTEEMIAQLGNLNPQRLGVIARTSSMAYKKTTKTVDQIGRELGVDYVLEASVRRSGDRLRVTTQLIRSRDQTHVWARDYDRRVSDIVALQDDFSRAIAEQIQVQLAPQGQARLASTRPVNPQAYDAYLKGRFFWNKRTGEGLQKSIAYFQQAIEKDPNYALAYAGLADSFTLLGSGEYAGMSPDEAVPRAKAAAIKALQLDSTLAEAHTALGYLKDAFDWDWSGAEREFRQAVDLSPGYPTAHHWYALHLTGLARHAEAIAEIKKAQTLDPLSLIISTDAGTVLYYARRYDQAIEQLDKALELDPNFASAHGTLGAVYVEKKMYQQAFAEFQRAISNSGRSSAWVGGLGRAYALAGRKDDAIKIMKELKDESEHQFVPPQRFLVLYAALGDKEQAFAWLEKTYAERSEMIAVLKVDPRLDPLRSDPRFGDLLRRVGLAF